MLDIFEELQQIDNKHVCCEIIAVAQSSKVHKKLRKSIGKSVCS